MKTFIWMMTLGSVLISSILSAGKLVKNPADQILTIMDKANPLASGTPICLDRSYLPQEEMHWLYMPVFSTDLATNEYYGYLSGQLIQSGAVDASSCPLNGLWFNGYANACGLEKTRDQSLYLQNVYDDEILKVGKSFGVPPVMIKQLIRYESQFWPARRGLYHFGLGQLTYPGASNALTWSRDLYEATVAHAYPNTSTDLPSELLTMMDATCPSCQYGIDVPKAEQSITYLGEALLGICKQTTQVVYNAAEKDPRKVVDYATIWKLTLVNYNMGPVCVYNIVKAYHKIDDNDKLSWNAVLDDIDNIGSCSTGVRYAENITFEYYNFGTTR
jgi:hypothetical protein